MIRLTTWHKKYYNQNLDHHTSLSSIKVQKNRLIATAVFARARTMKTLSCFVLALLCLNIISKASAATSESYDKSCYLNYLVERNLLDKSQFRALDGAKGVSKECEAAVNAVLSQIRSSSEDKCVNEHLNRKYYSEFVLREFLKPQLSESTKRVEFGEKFKTFLDNSVSVTKVLCDHPKLYRPDVRELIKNGGFQDQEKMTKEIECLHNHLRTRGANSTRECKFVVDYVREEFYSRQLDDMKKSFAPPNDKIIDLDCCADLARKNQAFEKYFFFVILAITRKMNDRQTEVLRKSSQIMMSTYTKSIYECVRR